MYPLIIPVVIVQILHERSDYLFVLVHGTTTGDERQFKVVVAKYCSIGTQGIITFDTDSSSGYFRRM